MADWGIIVGVVAGTAIWLNVLRRYDRFEPESLKSLVLLLVFGGMLSFCVAGPINELFARGFGVSLAESRPSNLCGWFFLLSAANEELCKYGATRILSPRLAHVDEPIDWLIFGITVALGFAAVENVTYAAHQGYSVLVIRSILSVPAHMSFSAIWAWGLGLPVRSGESGRRRLTLAALIALAALVHAIFNVLVSHSGGAGTLFGLAFVGGLGLIANILLRKAGRLSPFRSIGYCGRCGHCLVAASVYCPGCGSTIQAPAGV